MQTALKVLHVMKKFNSLKYSLVVGSLLAIGGSAMAADPAYVTAITTGFADATGAATSIITAAVTFLVVLLVYRKVRSAMSA